MLKVRLRERDSHYYPSWATFERPGRRCCFDRQPRRRSRWPGQVREADLARAIVLLRADAGRHHRLEVRHARDSGTRNRELVSLAARAGDVARSVERATNAYWLREYLRRRRGVRFAAMVLGLWSGLTSRSESESFCAIGVLLRNQA